MKIHKLRITKKYFTETITNEDGSVIEFEAYYDEEHILENLMRDHKEKIVAVAVVNETGLIPLPVKYDEQGEPLPVQYCDGFRVDVMTTEVIQEWKNYTIKAASKWYHSFGYGEVVKAEDFV